MIVNLCHIPNLIDLSVKLCIHPPITMSRGPNTVGYSTSNINKKKNYGKWRVARDIFIICMIYVNNKEKCIHTLWVYVLYLWYTNTWLFVNNALLRQLRTCLSYILHIAHANLSIKSIWHIYDLGYCGWNRWCCVVLWFFASPQCWSSRIP